MKNKRWAVIQFEKVDYFSRYEDALKYYLESVDSVQDEAMEVAYPLDDGDGYYDVLLLKVNKKAGPEPLEDDPKYTWRWMEWEDEAD